MYDFFKNKAKNNFCMSGGVCSIHPSVNSLYQVLLSEIREISFYLVKLNEFKIENKNITSNCITILSTFLINTNFNKTKYLEVFKTLNKQKREVKEKYLNFSKENNIPFEVINTSFEVKNDFSVSKLIQYYQEHVQRNQKTDDDERFNLFELITIIARLCALNIAKIKNFESTFDKYDFEILRFFALTNSYSIKKEKIIRRIKEFAPISRKIKSKLDEIYIEKYGQKQDVDVHFDILKGYNILVSGSDFNELEDVLKAIEESKIENINVYTNGALLLAHQYQYFKNNHFLKGHFGTNNAEYDFSIFPGAILLTRNFIQKIDGLYKGEIFSNKLISFDNILDIKNYDYKPLLNACLKLENNNNKCGKNLVIKYKKEQIKESIENFNEKEIIILLDSKNHDNIFETYENKKILNFDFPFMEDILFETIEKLLKKDVKITMFFTQCSLITINILTSLLDLNLNLKIKPCIDAIINPHVIESLKKDFQIEMI